jgi:site-specific recombinase XerD
MRAKKKDANMTEETKTAQNVVDMMGQAIDDENVIELLDNKIDIVTAGLDRYLRKQLKKHVSRENSAIISDYSLIQKNEMNLSETYRSTTLSVLSVFCKALHNKSFLEITRSDILSYLDSLRKPEAIDPLHKWIGSYNLKRECLAKFFKWLYNPDITTKDRPIPHILKDIPRLKRKEQSIYLPSDLWIKEEDLIFLRYCPCQT